MASIPSIYVQVDESSSNISSKVSSTANTLSISVLNNSLSGVSARLISNPDTTTTLRGMHSIGVIDTLKELKDVVIDSELDGATLIYNAETGNFETIRIAGIGEDIDGGTF